MKQLKEISIFTDGACSGNPGTGGCAAILVHGEKTEELLQGYRWTTNNRMELMALIIALESLKSKSIVSIHTDSKYLLGAFEEKWLEKWKSNGWKTSAKKDVKNIDLWKRLDSLLSLHHPKFTWIKGHDGHKENARCDKLAVTASKTPPYLIDEIFEIDNLYNKR